MFHQAAQQILPQQIDPTRCIAFADHDFPGNRRYNWGLSFRIAIGGKLACLCWTPSTELIRQLDCCVIGKRLLMLRLSRDAEELLLFRVKWSLVI